MGNMRESVEVKEVEDCEKLWWKRRKERPSESE